MAIATLVSVEDYLATTYRPDCEYVDGEILERNLGEYDHASLQGAFVIYFFQHRKQWGITAVPEQRVQVNATRFRVPDVCVMPGTGPFEQIFRTPPFICIEILSPEDTVERLQERIDDYLTFGVPYVWLINPRSRRGFVYTTAGMHEPKDGVLRTGNPEIVVPLAEVFRLVE